MVDKDKKILVSIIVGVVAMVIIVAGATYAYFSIPIQNNFSETKVQSNIEDVGNVTLLPEVNELSLNLSISDMVQKGENVAYYGTNEGSTTVESTEVIAKASVTGNGVFNCTYDLTMNATGEKNMYDAVQSMTTKEGSVYLTVNGVRYDFGTPNLFPKTIKGEINGLTEGNSQDITAQIMLINRTSMNQDALKGTDIEITFNMDNFKCDAVEMGSSGAYVMKTSPANISEELIEGLYRFQGSKDEVDNNYICFGTSDKDACLNYSGLLYRIVGITPNGELKIMYNGTENRSEWASTYAPHASFADSTLFYTLQGASTNYSAEWMNLILNKEWKYGDYTQDKLVELTLKMLEDSTIPFSEYIKVEKNFNNTIKAKVGLLTLTDIITHDPCHTTIETLNNCSNTGWMFDRPKNGDNAYMWLLTKLGKTSLGYEAFVIGSETIEQRNVTESRIIRPVGYLDANLTLSGTGTVTDPYIISL